MNWIKEHITEILIAIYAILAPQIGLIIAIGFLSGFDFITGILSARKQNIPISSLKMGRTVSKMCLYSLAILTGVAIEYVIGNIVPVVKLIAGLITLVESKSIFENLYKLTGINFLDQLKSVFNRNLENTPTLNKKVIKKTK